MQPPLQPSGYNDVSCVALAYALKAIPIPVRVKERTREHDKVVVRERVLTRDVTVDELVSRMTVIDGVRRNHRAELRAGLALLQALGVIEIEGMRVYATSEPAGYLLHNLAEMISTTPFKKSSITANSNIKRFRSILEVALVQNELNPHLVLSNIIEQGLYNTKNVPLRSVRVVSVLIKGEEVARSALSEPVYLHVRKPGWESYALIGSVQEQGMNDEMTALLALEEDLETPRDHFVVRPADVADEYDSELSITRGVFTGYSFALFVLQELRGELKLRDDLEYAWFTYEEIRNQRSMRGESIMTKAGLLQRMDEFGRLRSVPTIIANISPSRERSVVYQAKRLMKEAVDVIREMKLLIEIILSSLWSRKQWLLALFGIAGVLLLLRPFIGRNIPSVSVVADILTIIGFIISVCTIAWELYRRRRLSG